MKNDFISVGRMRAAKKSFSLRKAKRRRRWKLEKVLKCVWVSLCVYTLMEGRFKIRSCYSKYLHEQINFLWGVMVIFNRHTFQDTILSPSISDTNTYTTLHNSQNKNFSARLWCQKFSFYRLIFLSLYSTFICLSLIHSFIHPLRAEIELKLLTRTGERKKNFKTPERVKKVWWVEEKKV